MRLGANQYTLLIETQNIINYKTKGANDWENKIK
jgi:hypothetical protein